MSRGFDETSILAIERPDPKLWIYYILRCLVVPPVAPILLPIHWFRYHTMRYRFTEEGVSMSWGVLFRRQVLLNYARIQDIHLQSNVVERWLGIGRLLLQTASGSATAEMTIEGLTQFEAVRDFLYSRMRGVKEPGSLPQGAATTRAAPATIAPESGSDDELTAVLREVTRELRGLREDLAARQTQATGRAHE
ncbi:MAG: PH domain-containing protein [Verrucomicrobiae bacterium]|nr:PH domain-containing protein [Verrucomicrobiae bacterium]